MAYGISVFKECIWCLAAQVLRQIWIQLQASKPDITLVETALLFLPFKERTIFLRFTIKIVLYFSKFSAEKFHKFLD